MYPHLTLLIREVALDNRMPMLPEDEWKWPDNVKELEKEAAKLDDGEKEVFAAGEHDEIRALTKKYKIGKLAKFLGEAFDGDLTQCFYKMP